MVRKKNEDALYVDEQEGLGLSLTEWEGLKAAILKRSGRGQLKKF